MENTAYTVVQRRDHGPVTLALIERFRRVAVACEGLVRGLPQTRCAGWLVFRIRVVSGVERNVAEERPTLVSFDELTRRIGKNKGAVAVGLCRLGVAVEVVTTVVNISVIIAVSGDIAEILIEAPIRGSAAAGKAEVPFAEAAADISCFGEIARQDHLGVRQRDLLKFVNLPELFVQTIAQRMPTGEQGTARRHAGRRGNVEVGAADSFGSEPVDPRRLSHLIAIASQITIADIIEEHDHDVRSFDIVGGVADIGQQQSGKA